MDGFSDDLKSALIDLFQSLTLNTVEISHIVNLPISILSALTHVKRLKLIVVMLSVPSFNLAWVLPEIEALDLTIDIQPLQDSDWTSLSQISFSFPNLRHLSIWCHNEHLCTFMQQVITASARSIRHVTWVWGRLQVDKNRNIDLGVITNLHVLTLVFYQWGRYHKILLPSIVKYLQNSALTRDLQELIIEVQMDGALALPPSIGWEDLDVTLSSLPALQSVLLRAADSTELQLVMMEGFLPRLVDRGILSVEVGSIRRSSSWSGDMN